MKQLLPLLLLALRCSLPCWGQRCTTRSEAFDRQILLPNGELILLSSWKLGCGGDNLSPNLTLTRLDSFGTVLERTSHTLPDAELYAHFSDYPTTAEGRTLPLVGPFPLPVPKQAFLGAAALWCGGYNPYVPGRWVFDVLMPDSTHPLVREVNARLPSAERYRPEWFGRYANDARVKQADGYYLPYPFPYRYLDRRYPYLPQAVAPGFQVENDTCIRLVGEAAYLRPRQAKGVASRLGPYVTNPTPWRVQGPGWQVILDGFLDTQAPLVNVSADHRLYVVVNHYIDVTCGLHLWPILYCIDLRGGKVMWRRDMRQVEER